MPQLHGSLAGPPAAGYAQRSAHKLDRNVGGRKKVDQAQAAREVHVVLKFSARARAWTLQGAARGGWRGTRSRVGGGSGLRRPRSNDERCNTADLPAHDIASNKVALLNRSPPFPPHSQSVRGDPDRMPERILRGHEEQNNPIQPSQTDFAHTIHSQRPAMTAAHAESHRPGRGPAICPTDDDAIVPRKPAAQASARKLDKRSWEYIIKSGVAGGVAGCAVCAPFHTCKRIFGLTVAAG